MVVEDHVPLATCLEMLLEANSYEVIRTVDGAGALESIKLMDFDVILSDLVMPGLDGYQLHSAVQQIKPHLCDRFIFMSGHPDKAARSSTVSYTGRPVLWKPFATSTLLAAVEEITRMNSGKAQAGMGPDLAINSP